MSTVSSELHPDVVIVGAGPAGLTAATALKQLGIPDVLVLDREGEAGGIPRHSDHTGYGLRDLRRVMTGPAYARHLVARAQDAGVDLRTQAHVTNWIDASTLAVTTPAGRLSVHADAIVLATGARERPRAARLVPGDRPAGVMTTGQLQTLVHEQQGLIGTSAVIVGAELVSWSAALTLREAGCAVALMTTAHEASESYAAFSIPGRALLRIPVATRTKVTRIVGRHRVEAVEVEDLTTGIRREIECDFVVFTGDWIPDHELARTVGLDLDPVSQSPLVDASLRTSRPGMFAAGNLLHPVDTADVAALSGRHVARSVRRWLITGAAPANGYRLLVDPPFAWIAPGVIRPDDPSPPRGRLLLRCDTFIGTPRIVVKQNGRAIARRRIPWPASPGRIFRIPSAVLDGVDPTKGDVRIGLS
jgi:thioredoxin reductase